MVKDFLNNNFILGGLPSDWSKTMRFHWTTNTTSKILSFTRVVVFLSEDFYQFIGLMGIGNTNFSSKIIRKYHTKSSRRVMWQVF